MAWGARAPAGRVARAADRLAELPQAADDVFGGSAVPMTGAVDETKLREENGVPERKRTPVESVWAFPIGNRCC